MPVAGALRTPVEEKLIAAAGEMLAEVGPRATSVRAVAQRAGVNHGLVHHYFGSKDALLSAAMHELVRSHAQFARNESHGSAIPAPLALLQDQTYLRAVVRCVLDGELDLATTEISEGVSVPQAALSEMTTMRGLPSPDATLRAMLGIGVAIEMGWAALEPFIAAVTGTDTQGMAEVRSEAIRLRQEIVARWWTE